MPSLHGILVETNLHEVHEQIQQTYLAISAISSLLIQKTTLDACELATAVSSKTGSTDSNDNLEDKKF